MPAINRILYYFRCFKSDAPVGTFDGIVNNQDCVIVKETINDEEPHNQNNNIINKYHNDDSHIKSHKESNENVESCIAPRFCVQLLGGLGGAIAGAELPMFMVH